MQQKTKRPEHCQIPRGRGRRCLGDGRANGCIAGTGDGLVLAVSTGQERTLREAHAPLQTKRSLTCKMSSPDYIERGASL